MIPLRRSGIAAVVPAAVLGMCVCDAAAQTSRRDRPDHLGPVVERDLGTGAGKPGSGAGRGGAAPRGDGDGTDIEVSADRATQQNETSLSINPLDPDNWVGASNDLSTLETAWYSTTDAGKTWTRGKFALESGYLFSGDPAVTFDARGDVHVLCMMYDGPGGRKVTSFSSRDGGLTWEPPVDVSLHPDNDKPQVDADLSGGPFHGDVTTAWDRFDFGNGIGDTYVATTQDGGRSWTAEQRINDDGNRDGIAPDVAYGPNSVLYVACINLSAETVWLDTSHDGGATWGTDQTVTTFHTMPNPLPGSNFRILPVCAAAADWTDGRFSGTLYITYPDWREFEGHVDIRCIFSRDGGQTWTDKRVHDDPSQADQFFSGIDTDPHGNVHVCYYDRRLDPGNFEIWTWLSRSINGGRTWREFQVSDAGWDHTQTEQRIFIGDYSDVDSSARDVVPFWCDGRHGSQDVFIDRLSLDLTTSQDRISAASGGTVDLFLEIGPNHQNSGYRLLGSFTGTEPGIDFPSGVHLPLNFDAFTVLTLFHANSATFQNFRGTLDQDGRAVATLDTGGPIDPGLAGLELDFAALLDNAGVLVHASSPTRIVIDP